MIFFGRGQGLGTRGQDLGTKGQVFKGSGFRHQGSGFCLAVRVEAPGCGVQALRLGGEGVGWGG